MNQFLIILALLLSCNASGTAKDAENSTLVPPARAAVMLATKPAPQLLDVRTREEYATGHLKNATLIPWTDKDFKTRASKQLDPEKPVLVYCHSGRRSALASAALKKLGFKSVTGLDGGILAWQKARKPVKIGNKSNK